VLLHKNNNGKIVSHTEKEIDQALFDNVHAGNQEDLDTGSNLHT